MQLIADFFPLILFFAAFKWQGIFVATGVAIAASVVQILWFHWKRKLTTVHWLSFGIIVVFGGATLLLHDENFIKWKPTVLYWAFAAILVVGKLAFRRDLIAGVLRSLELPAPVWTWLTWAWAAFLAVMGVLNLYVAFNFPLATWVNFKVWGATGLCLVFAVVQAMFLARHMNDERPQT
ncbi:MAG: septation protein A [Betaproteobacteria bacterium]